MDVAGRSVVHYGTTLVHAGEGAQSVGRQVMHVVAHVASHCACASVHAFGQLPLFWHREMHVVATAAQLSSQVARALLHVAAQSAPASAEDSGAAAASYALDAESRSVVCESPKSAAPSVSASGS
jgi:hypothetical protein